MFLVDAWAYRSNHDAVDFCVLLTSFWCDIVDGKIRIRTMYRIVRVYPESVFLTSNNMRMCDGNMDTLVVHWYRHWLVVAFVAVSATMMTSTMWTMMMMRLVRSYFVSLHCFFFGRKIQQERQNNTNFAQCFFFGFKTDKFFFLKFFQFSKEFKEFCIWFIEKIKKLIFVFVIFYIFKKQKKKER